MPPGPALRTLDGTHTRPKDADEPPAPAAPGIASPMTAHPTPASATRTADASAARVEGSACPARVAPAKGGPNCACACPWLEAAAPLASPLSSLQRRHARERPGQDVEGTGLPVEHGKGASGGVGRQPSKIHPLQRMRVGKSQAGQGQHEQLR